MLNKGKLIIKIKQNRPESSGLSVPLEAVYSQYVSVFRGYCHRPVLLLMLHFKTGKTCLFKLTLIGRVGFSCVCICVPVCVCV